MLYFRYSKEKKNFSNKKGITKMRITEELKARIERDLSKKYKAEFQKNEEEYRATVAKEKPAIIAELENILSMPAGHVLATVLRGGSSLTADKIFENWTYAFCRDAYEKKSKADAILNEKKRLDYEELAIQIAYQKDIEGIKTAFTIMGLTF